MKFIRIILILFGLAVMFPVSIEACSLCMSAAADWLLPPIVIWAVISIVLFLSASIIKTISGIKLWGIPSIGFALLIIFAVFILGAAFLGLGILVFLLIPLVILVINVFRKNPTHYAQHYRLFKLYSFVFIATLLALIFLTAHKKITRTPADFIISWSSTTPGRNALKQVCNEGENGLPFLRRIIREVPPDNAIIAAETIAKYGEARLDVALLIDMLKRTDIKSASYSRIESALSELSGLNPHQGSSFELWQELWEKQIKNKKDT